MDQLSIRKTEESDYRATEHITREAFWNLHVPGCDEHYLLHEMRGHGDFVKELDYVATLKGNVVGNIVYSRSRVESAEGEIIDTLTFGPVSVLPEYQKQGVGSRLIKRTLEIVRTMKIPAVIIYGHPHNYVKHGFVNGKRYGIGIGNEKYPAGLLVYMIDREAFTNQSHIFHESDLFNIDEDKVLSFDRQFPQKKREYHYSQEEFYIASHSFIEV